MNIYLTNMEDFAAMNNACALRPHHSATFQTDLGRDLEVIPDPKPARTCVCVKELPFKTDVCESNQFSHSY